MSTERETERHVPKLRDALDRYETDENFATWGALVTACAAIAGESWAQRELDTNPLWALPAVLRESDEK